MNDKTTITIEDELHVKITGLHKEVNKFFVEQYRTRPKNYRFDPRYKMGKWDGFIYKYTVTGSTYFNLLPEILDKLIKLDLKFKLIDKRKKMELSSNEIDDSFLQDLRNDVVLGQHQVESVNAVLKNHSGVIRAATGAGKTFICASLLRYYNQHGLRCVIIVPTGDLVIQTAKEVSSFGIETGRMNKDYKELTAYNLCSTWQSMQNSPQLLSAYDVIILDECHTISGPNLQQIIDNHTCHMPARIAMTGTLPDNECDAMTLKCLFGELVYEIPAIDLINKGWLSTIDFECIVLEENFKERYSAFVEAHPELEADTPYEKFKREYFIDYDSESKYLLGNKSRLKFISMLIQSLQTKTAGKSNSLILVRGVDAGKYIASKIPGAVFIYGKDSSKVRQAVYDSFAENDDVTVVTTFKLASTGLNIKRIFNVFMIDANKSFTQIIQTIGRGLRTASDKMHLYLYDISSDLEFSTRHRRKRKSFYKAEGHKLAKDKKIDYSQLLLQEDGE